MWPSIIKVITNRVYPHHCAKFFPGFINTEL